MFLVCLWGRCRTELIFILTVRPIYDINGGIKKKIKLHKKKYNFVKKEFNLKLFKKNATSKFFLKFKFKMFCK